MPDVQTSALQMILLNQMSKFQELDLRGHSQVLLRYCPVFRCSEMRCMQYCVLDMAATQLVVPGQLEIIDIRFHLRLGCN